MTTPELLEVLESQTLIETVSELQSIGADDAPVLIETTTEQVLVDGEPAVVLIDTEPATVVETAAQQGPRGAQGPMGPMGEVKISGDPKNRITRKPDGLHVLDDLIPDPVAYYVLSKG